jgi:hypothetical protein
MNELSKSSPAQSSVTDIHILRLRLSILAALFTAALVFPCHSEEPTPNLNYEAVPDFFQLPPGNILLRSQE